MLMLVVMMMMMMMMCFTTYLLSQSVVVRQRTSTTITHQSPQEPRLPSMQHRSTPHLCQSCRLQPHGELTGRTTCASSSVLQPLPVRPRCRAVVPLSHGQRSAATANVVANVVVQLEDETTDMGETGPDVGQH